MITDTVRRTAAQCRHYAMCKIDYLGTGLCPAAVDKPYVAYFPQGRMDLVDALARGIVPVTEGLLDIAASCTLCGACDIQCHFYSGLRPLPVMAALKDAVSAHQRSGGPAARPPQDPFVERLRGIVGAEWASNDPAILVTYAHDPFPLKDMLVPRAVVLPGSACEVEEVVRAADEARIPFAIRGNGASVYGQVFSEGLVLDMARMKKIDFDTDNWSVTIGPGVTAFELQREAARRGFRVNVAEPAATVIGNIICTGLFSTWSAAYGMGADHVLDMEFVDRRGCRFRLNAREGPGSALIAYRHGEQQVPAVCTEAMIRLHPVTGDEEGVIVPFGNLEEAVRFARDLAVRRIGLAVAVLGPHYIGAFISPDLELTQKLKRTLTNDLGIAYGVFVVADPFGLESVRRMASRSVINQELFRDLVLGLPRLVDADALDILRSAEGSRAAFEMLAAPAARSLLQAILEPSPETLASAVEPDLRPVYADLYERPELTDMVWLNAFRIVSARMGRHKHIIAFILFIPMDERFAGSLCARFAEVAAEIGIDHDYGFITPIDMGKRAVLEYDYYIDQADPAEKEKTGRAMGVLVPWLDGLCAGPDSNMTWLKTVFTQGTARKESWFYRDLAGRPR